MNEIRGGAPVRVLFVDDEEKILRSIKRLLMEESYEVLTAKSGEEALELLKDGQDIGLIVSDQRMPGMQGVDLLKQASEISPDTLRIMLTGYSDINAAIDAINKGGAYQYITKPWKDDELIQTVRDAVYRYSLVRDNKRLTEIVKRQNEELKQWNDQLQYRVQEQTIKIRESEEKFRSLFDEAPVGYHEADKEGCITNVNRSELEMLGYTAEEMLGQPIWKFAVEPGLVKQAFEARITGDLPAGQAFECTYCRKDGTSLVVLAGDKLLKDRADMITGIRTTIQDITELKRAEEAFRESEARLKLQIERMPIACIVFDPEFRVTTWNPAAQGIFGFTFDEVKGKHPDGLIVPKQVQPHTDSIWQRLLGSDYTAHSINQNITKDGRTIICDWANTPLRDTDGKVLGLLSMVQDITERKQMEEALRLSEEKYRLVLDNASEAICVTQDGMLRFLNPKTVELMGFPIEEVTSTPFVNFVHPEDREMMLDRYQTRISGKDVPRFYPFRIVDRNGNTRWVENSSVLISWEGRPATLSFLTDITERKQAEQEKASLEEQFRQSQKMEAIGRLAGGIAHDFNNLLTIIKGYGQLSSLVIQDGSGLKGNIQQIQKAADRASDLIRQLLAFSRRQVMEMKILNLNDVLRDFDKMLRRVIGEDVELATLLAKDLGTVAADPGQIEQVVMNLAVNARDAMPNGGMLTIETSNVELDEVYIRSHVAVTPGRYVMLSVSDMGAGMTPEVKERIFEPFFTTKEQGKGTGLGLSTVYGIVKQSGGNIWVYSEPGKGTTFKIYLPRVDEPIDEIVGKVEKDELSRGSETVLVVEDEEGVRKFTVQTLEMLGYTVLEAPQGRDALLVSEQHKEPIHLLVTDVVMPGMSGREVAQRLSPLHPRLGVLYMSGYTGNAIAHHGVLEKGMNYIQKPFTIETLARKVRGILDGN